MYIYIYICICVYIYSLVKQGILEDKEFLTWRMPTPRLAEMAPSTSAPEKIRLMI